MIRVPFNAPSFEGREVEYILAAISAGHISGDGQFSRRCEDYLEQSLGVAKALLTTSCTDALEMTATLLNIQPGDEVIVPSFTFVSTANAFVSRGARPVFLDIRPDTLNVNEDLLANAITPLTRAIVVVHYAGIACDMTTIKRVADDYGIPVVEDNAHGLFARHKGDYLGTFGELATQSFHETKNFSCGEGGALLINDPALIERAEIIREKGTDRKRFFRGEVDKYTWVDVGSSYLPSDLLAAVLWGQFECRDIIQSKRRAIFDRYRRDLTEWAGAHHVGLPHVPDDSENPYHMFYLLMPSEVTRDALIQELRVKEIMSVFHYVPLHLSPMGRRFGGREGDCPVTERVSGCLMRLPFYNALSTDSQRYVTDAIRSAAVWS